jgi:hypothetical protein
MQHPIMITVKFPQKINARYINQKFRKMILVITNTDYLTLNHSILMHRSKLFRRMLLIIAPPQHEPVLIIE